VWAAYWVMGTQMLAIIGYLTWKPLMALDPGLAIDTLALRLWHLEAEGPAASVGIAAALISLTVHLGLALGLLYWRVSRLAVTSVGASS
jgi:hypothetical protein